MPLDVNGTTIFVDTRTLTQRELDECPHIILTSQHPWDPHSVWFPRTSRYVQEEVEMRQSNIGAVGSQPKYSEANIYNFEEGGDNVTVLFDMDDMSRRIISSAKVTEIPRMVSNVTIQDVLSARTLSSKGRHTDLSSEDLSEWWNVVIGQAKETINRTYQLFVRSVVMPLSRHYQSDRIFHKQRLCVKWYTYTMDGRIESIDGNRYAQVFKNKAQFVQVYHMDKKSKAGYALRTFINEIGVP